MDVDVLNEGLIAVAEKLGNGRERYGCLRIITSARYNLASQWTERGVFEKGTVIGTALYLEKNSE